MADEKCGDNRCGSHHKNSQDVAYLHHRATRALQKLLNRIVRLIDSQNRILMRQGMGGEGIEPAVEIHMPCNDVLALLFCLL